MSLNSKLRREAGQHRSRLLVVVALCLVATGVFLAPSASGGLVGAGGNSLRDSAYGPYPPVGPGPRPSTPSRPVPAPVDRPASKKPCAGLKGGAASRCKLTREVRRRCAGKRGRSGRLCARRVKALARCRTIKGSSRRAKARKRACVRRARQIGRRR